MTNKIYNPSLFEAIKTALIKESKVNSRKDILKFAPGNTYTVRLIPNVKEPNKTFLNYIQVTFTSRATGQLMNYISPSTFNERDPILEYRFKTLKTGSEAEKELVKSITRKEKWACNVYVIDDPVTPENKNTIKVIRYGKQLYKIIDSAINGDDAAEFGARVFDLSKDGVNLKIKCENQGDFPTFTSSRFTSPVDLKLTEDQQADIYNGIHDLESLISVPSREELQTMLAEHILCEESIPAPQPAPVKVTAPAEIANSDVDVDDLLKGL